MNRHDYPPWSWDKDYLRYGIPLLIVAQVNAWILIFVTEFWGISYVFYAWLIVLVWSHTFRAFWLRRNYVAKSRGNYG